MAMFLVVLRQSGPEFDRSRPLEEQSEWEAHAELGLQPADLLGDRRLRHMQLRGSGRERAVPIGGEEILELL